MPLRSRLASSRHRRKEGVAVAAAAGQAEGPAQPQAWHHPPGSRRGSQGAAAQSCRRRAPRRPAGRAGGHCPRWRQVRRSGRTLADRVHDLGTWHCVAQRAQAGQPRQRERADRRPHGGAARAHKRHQGRAALRRAAGRQGRGRSCRARAVEGAEPPGDRRLIAARRLREGTVRQGSEQVQQVQRRRHHPHAGAVRRREAR